MTSPRGWPALTVYVLTCNEASQLRELLPTVRWADEVLVVDSFSSDDTAKVCETYGARHVNEAFQGFGALRNRALELASYDWVVSIDSDERSTPEFAVEVGRRLAAPEAVAYFVPRLNYFLGQPVRHGGMYPDFRQPQVFDRRYFRYRDDLVHEGWDCAGPIGRFRHPVLQIPFPTMSVAMRKVERYTSLMARRYHAEGRRATARRIVLHPIGGFLKKYLIQQGFRDGKRGFILAALHAYYGLLKYAKLLEIQTAAHRFGEHSIHPN